MIDLHLHLDGSINPENVPVMAKMSGVGLDYSGDEWKKDLMVTPDCRNLGEYLKKFDLPLKLLQTEACIEYAVYELMRDLEEQGLCYAEIRFAPQLHRQRNLSQEETVQAAIRGLNRGNRDFSIMANLILCCMRGDDNEHENMETVRLAENYLGKGICAVDLAGNEAAYPTRQFKEIFAAAGRKNVPVIIHAGEAAGAESVKEALAFGAVRIGHGIHAAEDPELMRELCEKHICLEMCYTSNLQTKTVNRAEDYPIKEFLANGLAVTLNTDNLTVSNTTLKKEYQLIKEQFQIDEEGLMNIGFHALQAAFLPDDEKEYLRCRMIKEFSEWINTGVSEG